MDLSSKVLSGIPAKDISQVVMNLTHNMYLEFTLLKLLPHLPGATVLTLLWESLYLEKWSIYRKSSLVSFLPDEDDDEWDNVVSSSDQ